ncbi:MAG: ferritin-like domain-containing protein [Nitrospinales bacterium]
MVSSDKNTSVKLQCHEALDLCISIEKEGIIYYEKASKLVKNQKVKKIFSRLAEDEREHSKSLKGKAKFLQPALLKKIEANDSLKSFFDNEVKGKIFPLQSDGASLPKSDQEAVEIGIESEKRSIEILLKLIESERKMDVRVVFSHLLAEEKKHLAALESLKKELLVEEA